MSDEDAARSSLFGSAPARKSAAAAAAAAAAAPSDASLGFNDSGDAAASRRGAPAAAPAALDDDPARSALLAGGRLRPAAAAPPPPAVVIGDGAALLGIMPDGNMDEGELAFDFDDLNITAAANNARNGGGSSSSSPVGGGGGDDGALDFSAIDADLERFSQDAVIRDALNRGVDLREYSKAVSGELRAMESLSIADYVKEADSIAGLFEQIQSCEGVLGTMAQLLQSFQDNLGGISDEIRSLQEASLSLSVNLQNRKNLGGKVRAFLAKVAVSEGLIARICDAPIDESWLRDLRALSEKIEFCSGVYRDRDARAALPTHAPTLGGLPALPADEPTAAFALDALAELSVNPYETPAGRDAVPQIEKLRLKAVSRVKEFLLRGIAEVTKPRGNMARQQEHGLLKFAYAAAFLSEHGPEAARDVRTQYADGVGRAYGDIFKRYAEDLGRAALPLCNKNDTLANFDTVGAPGGAAAAVTAGGTGAARPVDAFSVEASGRLALLLEGGADAPPLAVHVVQAEKQRLPWEAVFRSLQRHLLDVAGGEEVVLKRLFGESDGRDVFNASLKNSVTASLEAVEAHVSSCWDGPGLLLTLAITAAHKAGHIAKGLKGLSSAFDRVGLLVWPRWKLVFEANAASVRAAAAALAGGKRGVLPPADPAAVHPLTARFAAFNASALLLHRVALAGAGAPLCDDTLPTQLAAMGREVAVVWTRLAADLGKGGVPRSAFLLNQHAAVLAALQAERFGLGGSSGGTGGPVGGATAAVADALSADVAAAGEAHGRALNAFVEDALNMHLRAWVAWVTKVEGATAAALAATRKQPPPGAPGAPPPLTPQQLLAALPEGFVPPVDPVEGEAACRDMGLVWRGALKALNEEVTRCFGGGVGGNSSGGDGAKHTQMNVLKALFSAFADYHQRGAALAARAHPSAPWATRDLVQLQTIYFEMRSFSKY